MIMANSVATQTDKRGWAERQQTAETRQQVPHIRRGQKHKEIEQVQQPDLGCTHYRQQSQPDCNRDQQHQEQVTTHGISWLYRPNNPCGLIVKTTRTIKNGTSS